MLSADDDEYVVWLFVCVCVCSAATVLTYHSIDCAQKHWYLAAAAARHDVCLLAVNNNDTTTTTTTVGFCLAVWGLC